MVSKKDEKRVEIELFKDSERYKDDVFVAVNGKAYQIRRGERVSVPAAVAEVIENSRRQEKATADLISRRTSEFSSAIRSGNI